MCSAKLLAAMLDTAGAVTADVLDTLVTFVLVSVELEV